MSNIKKVEYIELKDIKYLVDKYNDETKIRKLTLGKEEWPLHRCEDQIVGNLYVDSKFKEKDKKKYKNSNYYNYYFKRGSRTKSIVFESWVLKENRKSVADKYVDISKWESKEKNKPKPPKRIVVVLESPHIEEFSSDFNGPALGRTGENFDKFFAGCILNYMLDQDDIESDLYEIALVNAIQHRASLGVKPNYYRDLVCIYSWINGGRKDFRERLKGYSPDIIINLCTKGNHININDKGKITGSYLKRIWKKIYEKEEECKFRKFFKEEIDEYCKNHNVTRLKGTHPFSWFSPRNRSLKKVP